MSDIDYQEELGCLSTAAKEQVGRLEGLPDSDLKASLLFYARGMLDRITLLLQVGSKVVIGQLREGGPITLELVDGKEVLEVTADFDIDCDGTGGNPHHDPYFQPATRLQYKGQSLCAEKVPYYVVPPLMLQKTKGKVLGSKVELTNTQNGKTCIAVVGDSGPSFKDGEGSPRAAELLGLDPNPNHGGTSEQIIKARIYVGVPAEIDGVTYDLQSA